MKITQVNHSNYKNNSKANTPAFGAKIDLDSFKSLCTGVKKFLDPKILTDEFYSAGSKIEGMQFDGDSPLLLMFGKIKKFLFWHSFNVEASIPGNDFKGAAKVSTWTLAPNSNDCGEKTLVKRILKAAQRAIDNIYQDDEYIGFSAERIANKINC